ncbi:MAG: tetratricopeptide repeat protein [Crocinitomicaceae bacterium]|nr:tetratricopeptide repeat protein [Crocinitomicaceae bacterium]NGF74948.1 tetratricopeptide repeat protein [Fluviicola sp. SGL-29]
MNTCNYSFPSLFRHFTLCLALMCMSQSLYAQSGTDAQLANHYYNNGDYAKAKEYYEKLYKREPIKLYFERYYQCLVAESDWKNAEKLLKQQVDYSNGEVEYNVMLAQFYEDRQEQPKADKIYKSLVDNISPNPTAIINLFNAFKSKGKNDLAFQTITKGRSLLKNSYPLHFQFAEYYGATKETKKMIQEYLDLVDYSANYKTSVQNILSRIIDFSATSSEEYTTLKTELLQRTQSRPDDIVLSELVTWFFIQSKDFPTALMQEQAMDKRMDLKGRRVYDLGIICVENNDYTTSRKAFTYVKNLGENAPLYYQAENAMLNTRYKEIITARNLSATEMNETVREYESTIARIGKNYRSLPLIIELAHIQAFYNDRAATAIDLLNDALKLERLTDIQKAEIKMKLGDIHVLHGDIWEASLFYMQVDKDFKFEPIGQEARFKNARIFYYDGEFNYAQSQLDVLKQGTSKLISNDAIQLSLLITDNFGLDSNYRAMFWFASADLLIEQHKYTQAFQLFDSIIRQFPYHSLGDEILIKKSQAMQQQGKWSEALAYLDELLKYYGTDILADDAWFIKGEIYQNHLFDNEKAMECYKEILFKYRGSLHTTEARKRFRELRGDTIKEDEEL